MRVVQLLLVVSCLAWAGHAAVQPRDVTPATSAQVRHAYESIQSAFSNFTLLSSDAGLGSIFTEDGEWCSLMGSPCQESAANITAYAHGFIQGFNLKSAIAKFSGLSINNGYGSFDYVKTFTCDVAGCGPRTCLVPGKSGFKVDAASGKVVFLHDFVDVTEWTNLCVANCNCQN
eukprot:CAMPEP_0174837202 /NCGR_PEP_ID=MMETSP1114-20130205/6583_1 /TAXON_ID=312471 /ORGANISM="Neobodo designis, Strain CCAP 1951/1" /LENGTH=173 /DNA_ID=CAMNT_0016071251 /DNA_START=44 /DNA_END=565 /DNA_ORIENTATION=-